MAGLETIPPSNALYDQENLTLYRAGGYHPTRLGAKYKDGRYSIVHKLGWGGFSTVWLARDERLQIWVALKIGTAKSEILQRETSVFESLQRHRASGFIVELYDVFTHDGPNGSHLCIVTELLGPSVETVVADYHCGGDRLDSKEIIRLAKQLLQAIAAIHEAGYAHGDISSANICFTASKLRTLSDDAIFAVTGYPETVELVRKDGTRLGPSIPSELVRKAGWDDWIDEDEEDIRLIDWGEAFPVGDVSSRLAQPSDLRAPETIFADHFDQRVDLWRAGCVIYSLVFAAYPFQCLGNQNLLIAQMIGFVERLPSQWEEKAQVLLKEAGRNLPYSARKEPELDRRFSELVSDPDLLPLHHVVKSLMRFLPSDRMSARDAFRLLSSD